MARAHISIRVRGDDLGLASLELGKANGQLRVAEVNEADRLVILIVQVRLTEEAIVESNSG